MKTEFFEGMKGGEQSEYVCRHTIDVSIFGLNEISCKRIFDISFKKEMFMCDLKLAK